MNLAELIADPKVQVYVTSLSSHGIRAVYDSESKKLLLNLKSTEMTGGMLDEKNSLVSVP